ALPLLVVRYAGESRRDRPSVAGGGQAGTRRCGPVHFVRPRTGNPPRLITVLLLAACTRAGVPTNSPRRASALVAPRNRGKRLRIAESRPRPDGIGGRSSRMTREGFADGQVTRPKSRNIHCSVIWPTRSFTRASPLSSRASFLACS